MVGRDGVEPPEPEATDLQSAPLPLTVYLPICETNILASVYHKPESISRKGFISHLWWIKNICFWYK